MLKWRVWVSAAALIAAATRVMLAQEPVPLPAVEDPAVVEAACVESALCPAPCAPKSPWERKLELGLNGTDGNSETFNMRVGAKTKRTTDADVFSFDITYNKNTTSGLETAHKAFAESREEWLLSDSPWTFFVHGTMEYDEFKAFDVRLAGDLGAGYQLFKNDCTSLISRAGPGVSHEIGGPDDSFVPEAVFGIELEHKLSDRQKILASSEFTPAFEDFSDYRLHNKAAWEILCDPCWNMSLQLAVAERYDSTPNGAEPNDIDYSLLLIWGF